MKVFSLQKKLMEDLRFSTHVFLQEFSSITAIKATASTKSENKNIVSSNLSFKDRAMAYLKHGHITLMPAM
jgi:hypothetical protein